MERGRKGKKGGKKRKLERWRGRVDEESKVDKMEKGEMRFRD